MSYDFMDDEDGCEFPGQCCMPGPHTRSECHTAEMIQDYERECSQQRKAMASADPGETTLKFGKHKGEKLRDVPVAYLDWLLGIDLRDDLRADIESFLKTQAEYDQMDAPKDWREGREDYNGD